MTETRDLRALAPGRTVAGEWTEDVEADRLHRLLASIPDHPTRARTRRRWVVGAVATVALAGVATGAAAAGLVPDGVVTAFRHLVGPDSPDGFRVDDARRVAATAGPGGTRVEVWTGTNSRGGACEYIRTVTAGGHEDGEVSCFGGPQPAGWPDPEPFTAGFERPSKYLPTTTTIVFAYSTQDVARVELVFAGGDRVALQLNPETGWAIGLVSGHASERSTVIGYDAAGQPVARAAQDPIPRW